MLMQTMEERSTSKQIDDLKERMDERFGDVAAEFRQIDSRFESVEADIREIRVDLKSTAQELRQEIKSSAQELRQEMKENSKELRGEIAELRGGMESMQRNMLYGFMTLAGMILVLAGIQIA
jgi:uncharacterized protein YaaN involved in tellurite resistance